MSTQWSNPPSFEPSAGSQLGTGELSGFWRRLVALIIDQIVVGVVGGIIGFLVVLPFGGFTFNNNSFQTGSGLWVGLIVFVFGLLYYGYLWSSRGQTLGYMALGMRLVRTGGGSVGFGRSVGRAAAMLITLGSGPFSFLSWGLWIVALVSAFMVGLSARKMAIHDHIVDTQVVRA
jgi:uncharacterized RDD family membrane protein YckC